MIVASRKSWLLIVAAIAFASLAGFVPASAQDLGAIARREREKNKQNLPAHVYTNEDLARPEILLPADRARLEAGRPRTAPLMESAVAPPSSSRPTEIPLGDVARYYRELRQLRELQRLAREGVLPGKDALARPKLTEPEIIPSLPSRRSLPPDPFSHNRNRLPIPVAPRRAPAPVATENSIRIRRGDSLWKLAARYLGDGTKWREIAAANPSLSDPNVIRVGDQIQLPGAASAQAANQQRVERGDSLWKLASRHLGSGFAWTCIAQANPQISNPDRIYPGQILNLPAACGTVSSVTATARASTTARP